MTISQTYINKTEAHKTHSGTSALRLLIIGSALLLLLYMGKLTWAKLFPVAIESPQSVALVKMNLVQHALDLSQVLAISDGQEIDNLLVTVTLREDAAPLIIDAENLTVDYRDHVQQQLSIPWTATFAADSDDDNQLEKGEQLQLQITLKDRLAQPLTPGTEFVIDLKPSTQAILTLHYTLPNHFTAAFPLQ